MPDLATISAALGGIKTATDIARLIKDSGSTLEQAEINYKIAELIGALAETKIEIANVQIELIEKDAQISTLEEKLKNKDQTIGYKSARYLIGKNGEPTGAPYCPTCWATSKDLFPVLPWSRKEHTLKCGNCSNTIDQRHAPIDADYYIKSQREAAAKHGGSYVLKTTV